MRGAFHHKLSQRKRWTSSVNSQQTVAVYSKVMNRKMWRREEHHGRHLTGNTLTQHECRRWPDLEKILETPSVHAWRKETSSWNVRIWSLPFHGSPSSLRHEVVSPSHNDYRLPLGALCPPQAVPLLGHVPPLFPLLPIGLSNFESYLYYYKDQSNLVPIIFPAHTTYEDWTDRVFRNVGT